MEVQLLASLLIEEFDFTIGEAYDLARWILKRFDVRKPIHADIVEITELRAKR